MFLLSKIISIFILIKIIRSYNNIDIEFPVQFTYQKLNSNSRDNKNINGSYFGFSSAVLPHIEGQNNNVLIGAPKFNSRLYSEPNQEKVRTGAIFKCLWNEKQTNRDVICKEIDFRQAEVKPTRMMNLGSSLSINQNGFVGCAHLWVKNTSPVGKCFKLNSHGSLIHTSRTVASDHQNVGGDGRPLFSHLMYGFSSFGIQSDDGYIIGAPGFKDYLGSIVRYKEEKDTNNRDIHLDVTTLLDGNDLRLIKTNGYLGYSVTTGFFDSKSEYVVMSAPRNNIFIGEVLIFPLQYYNERLQKNSFKDFLVKINGESNAFGEYFGASLLTLDINNDRLDDLVVGAPLYSNHSYIEVGRVYVFIMDEKSLQFRDREIIFGYKSHSHFGSTLSSIDINLDNFQDLVVGAPFEENGDSKGAVYIYLGSRRGLDTEKPQMRIGAEIVKNLVLNGFGISIVSNTDFDGNGYNDLLIGSYSSENAVLLRTKPIASLSIRRIVFKPNKIRLKDKKCNQNQNSCFRVNYCVNYEGRNIRDKQPALITLEVTDRRLRNKEKRITNIDKSEQKSIELSTDSDNCFSNVHSFELHVKEVDLYDITTPIEIKLTVQLKNQSSDSFCKDCPLSSPNSLSDSIEFEHGCQNHTCVSKLTLSAVAKYEHQIIERTLIEGEHHIINLEIGVTNSGEAAINTVLNIRMTDLLTLTNGGDSYKCKPLVNVSSYRCELNKILQKNANEVLNLHFVVTRIPSNHLVIDLDLETSSQLVNSITTKQMKFDIIRRANLVVSSDAIKDLKPYSDKLPTVSIQVNYILVKSGASTIDDASLVIQLPTDIMILDGESTYQCRPHTVGTQYNFPIINSTYLDLNCEQRQKYCSKYKCKLPKFNSGVMSVPFTVNVALIPSRVQKLDFKKIIFKLYSELEIDDKVKFETDIKTNTTTTIYIPRDVPIIDPKVQPWVLFVSSGSGIIILIIAVIILIKVGFFKRKKLEEIEKVKLRMSMRPDMMADINFLDMTEEEFNELEN